MTRKILVNAYFSQNLGDDLFLKVLFDRYPNISWFLMTPNNKYKEIFKKYPNVKILKSLSFNFFGLKRMDIFHKLNNTLLKYRKFDALVTIGGSIFMEGNRWKQALIERESLPKMFRYLNKKTFILGANFGPFKDQNFVESHKRFFSLFNDICFRDNNSYTLFKDLEQVRVAPDVVFNLNFNSRIKKEKSIGFSIINIEKRKTLKNYYSEYNAKMIELIEHYIKQGYTILLFSFCENEGDLIIANHIKENVNTLYKKNIKIINYDGDIDTFLSKYQTCELIIGTRFHSIILALLFNQSVFPIIYSDKTYNVLNDLNINDYELINNIKRLDINRITPKVMSFDKEEICNLAKNQFRALDQFAAN